MVCFYLGAKRNWVTLRENLKKKMVMSLSTIKFVKLDTKEMEWNTYPTGRVEKRQKWKNA